MSLKIVFTILLALGGVGYIATQSMGDVQYYKMVQEVTADPTPWLSKNSMKIHGFVKAGSIETEIKDQKTHRSFVLENKGQMVKVRHTGPVPDTFKDQAETVVTGRLTREGKDLVVLALDGDPGISAKCPSKYNGDKR
jgi:cytochrome c-type biogenesis protein CcmE